MSFDILSGDMLFVDRLSYHWRAPTVGEPIVFHTRNVVGLRGPDGQPDNKYYIKRLVGLPGDGLEIREPVLYRNGAPITGAQAFLDNAEKLGDYPGYVNRGSMKPGVTVAVPAGEFYALGDNSPHSGDSRYWGGVPEAEVVGHAVFIFYPFSKRWGWAH
ncbi:MAG TPA: signal peptidase I [Opitutales bacterium]|nr:signal peptidase I [Opitutales bacterium]